MSRIPAGMPTTNPAIQVAVEGVRKRGCTRPNKRGRSPSRDIANQTRACPSWNTSNDEIMPIIAPNNTPRRTQCSVEDPVATVSVSGKVYQRGGSTAIVITKIEPLTKK